MKQKSERAVAYKLSKLYYLPKQGDPFKRKTICPACANSNPIWRKKCFTQFVHVTTGEPLDPMVGYCDYASCPLNKDNGAITPFTYFLNNNVSVERLKEMLMSYVSADKLPKREEPKLKPLRVDWADVEPTLSRDLSNIKINTLFIGLLKIFTDKFYMLHPQTVWSVVSEEMYDTYLVGTYMERNSMSQLFNAPIFWEIDENMEVREGKIMQYEERTAKRIKNCNSINWITRDTEDHKEKYSRERYYREHCLFGQHLLHTHKGEIREVYIVESQKTAIFMRIYCRLRLFNAYHNYVNRDGMNSMCAVAKAVERYGEVPFYMATGGSAMLTHKILEPLNRLKVVLVPDSGKATEHWREIADDMPNVSLNDVMERKRKEGVCGDNADVMDLVSC